MRLYYYIAIIFTIYSCSSTELKQTAETGKIEEDFYFGIKHSSKAFILDEESLLAIKLDLKNSAASKNIEKPEEVWKEINSISLKDGKYILFQLNTETRVPDKFLEFDFHLNGQATIKKHIYYVYSIEATTNGTRYNPYPYPVYGFYPTWNTYPVPMYPYYDQEVRLRGKHYYRFLVLFSSSTEKSGENIFRITTPRNNMIEFSYNIK